MKKQKLFLLMSGGLDSTIATLERISQRDFSEIRPIFINYGQKACEQEWKAVCKVSSKIAELVREDEIEFFSPLRIDLRWKTEIGIKIFQWSKSKLLIENPRGAHYVESRNLVLLSVMASFVESSIRKSEEATIVTGFRDEFSDTKREFVQLMNCVLSFLLIDKRKKIRVEAPIINYGPSGKKEMVEDFRKFNDILKLTWSCYYPKNGKPCSKCRACTDRKVAFPEDRHYNIVHTNKTNTVHA